MTLNWGVHTPLAAAAGAGIEVEMFGDDAGQIHRMNPGNWAAGKGITLAQVFSPSDGSRSRTLQVLQEYFREATVPFTYRFVCRPGAQLNVSGHAATGDPAGTVYWQLEFYDAGQQRIGGSSIDGDTVNISDAAVIADDGTGMDQFTVSTVVPDGAETVVVTMQFASARTSPLVDLRVVGSWVNHAISVAPAVGQTVTYRIAGNGSTVFADTNVPVTIGGFGGGSAAQVGDLLIAAVTAENIGSQDVTPPSGWTPLGSAVGLGTHEVFQKVFWKFATSGDLSGSQNFTLASAAYGTAEVGVYYNVAASPIVDVVAATSLGDDNRLAFGFPTGAPGDTTVYMAGIRSYNNATTGIGSVGGIAHYRTGINDRVGTNLFDDAWVEPLYFYASNMSMRQIYPETSVVTFVQGGQVYYSGLTPWYVVATSDDGLTWVPRDSPLNGVAPWKGYPEVICGAFHAGRWITGGDMPTDRHVFWPGYIGRSAQYSDDGITWTAIELAFDDVNHNIQFMSVAYGAGVWVAGLFSNGPANSAFILYSTDNGITWNDTGEYFGRTNAYMFGVAWNGEYFVGALSGANAGPSIAKSYDGISWTGYRTPMDGGALSGFTQAVGWGLGQWVAVGTRGGSSPATTIMTSPDGETWTSAGNPFGTFGIGRAVAYSWELDLWVAVGENSTGSIVVLVSQDAVTWTPVETPFSDDQAFGVTWTGDRFIASGINDDVSVGYMMSRDGLQWSRLPAPQLDTTGNPPSVANMDPAYFVINRPWPHLIAGGGDNTDNTIQLVGSTDGGVSWFPITTPPGITEVTTVLYAGGKWIAGGFVQNNPDKVIMTSYNGIDWEVQHSPMDGDLVFGFGWRPDGDDSGDKPSWVAAGDSNSGDDMLCTSEDAELWTARYNPFNDDGGGTGGAVHFAQGKWVFVGSSTNRAHHILTSTDGISWEAQSCEMDSVPDLPYGRPYGFLFGLTYGNGMWVAVGDSDGLGNLFSSPDGVTWTTRPNPMYNPAGGPQYNGWIGDVLWNGEQFVACGNSQPLGVLVMTSPDGITWTAQSTPLDSIQHHGWKVGWNGEVWVVAADGATDNYQIMTSPDGVTWTGRPSLFDTGGGFAESVANGLIRPPAAATGLLWASTR